MKYKIGDKVKVDGGPGVVVIAVTRPDGTPVYGVRLPSWKKVQHCQNPDSGEWTYIYENPDKPGEFRDHEADTLGGVTEDRLQSAFDSVAPKITSRR